MDYNEYEYYISIPSVYTLFLGYFETNWDTLWYKVLYWVLIVLVKKNSVDFELRCFENKICKSSIIAKLVYTNLLL